MRKFLIKCGRCAGRFVIWLVFGLLMFVGALFFGLFTALMFLSALILGALVWVAVWPFITFSDDFNNKFIEGLNSLE